MIYWFTGQPGHGKTTIATLLVSKLETMGRKVFHIDGDSLRKLTLNVDYSRQGRKNNIKKAQAIAHYLHEEGYEVVVSLVSPYRKQREKFKKLMDFNIHEFFVNTKEIRIRDEYKVIDYEIPISNYINVDTTDISPIISLEKILWTTEKEL